MTPELRRHLVAADAMLRRQDAAGARALLDQLALSDSAGIDAPEFRFLLAQACFQSGDPQSAHREITMALDTRPQWFEALHLLGMTLADLGLADNAARALERALDLRPQHVRTCVNLAAVYRRQGLPQKAITLYRRATMIDGDNLLAWRGLAESLQSLDHQSEAIEAWERWVALVPDRAEGLAGLGWAYMCARRWNDAERYLAEATALPAADYHSDVLLGFVRRERGDTAGALEAYRAGSLRAPAALTPAVAVALMLPPVYSSLADIDDWRQRFSNGIGTLRSEWPRFLERPAAVWDLNWTNFYLGYQGRNDLSLQSAYADLVGQLTTAAAPEWATAPDVAASTNGKLRIGFASSYFRRCTVGAYFQSWLLRLDRSRFEVHAIYFGNEIDDTTESLRQSVERFEHASGDGVRAIAERIRNARLDVLVYPALGMDGRDATLSAMRLAPVQCAAWGHPLTTGSSAIDYFFSCADMEPDDARDHYRERLLLLPGLGTAYRCPEVRPATRAEFGLPDGVPLYVCPQSLFKIHPDNDALFGALLEADPRGLLVFCAEPGQPVTLDFQRRIAPALHERGIDFERRVLWQPMRGEPDFRAMLSVCDVLFDSLHWSGGNTSLDALAAGLPIVTLPGRFLRGRQSAAMLRTIGLPQLIAGDESEMVAIAAGIANDRDALRSHIAGHRGLLFDRDEPIRALEEHLLQISGRDL